MATAYTDLNTIHNPATGTSPPASWGDGVRDNDDALFNPPLSHAYNSAVQVVGDASDTILTYNSEYEDTDTLHSTSSNTGRFTATKAGWYLVLVHASIESNATGRRRLTLRKNGSAQAYESRNADSGGTTNICMSWMLDMSATDYADVLIYQNSGGDLDVTAEYQIIRVAGT